VSAGDATGHRSSGGAARVLCHWLRRNRDALALQRRNVVELGCGLGLAGLYAARTAAAVTLTDGDERALALARRSHALNAHTLRAAVRFRSLPWSADAQLAPLFAGDAEAGGPSEAATIRAEELPVLLLGADLFYYGGGVAALMDAIAALLPAEGGLAALAANPRYPGWASDVDKASQRLGLEARSMAVEALLPPADLATGWFAHTRLVRASPHASFCVSLEASTDCRSRGAAAAVARWRCGAIACAGGCGGAAALSAGGGARGRGRRRRWHDRLARRRFRRLLQRLSCPGERTMPLRLKAHTRAWSRATRQTNV
jgi:SAM-dependent methyltransferase